MIATTGSQGLDFKAMLDHARGVGGPALNKLVKYLPSKDQGGLDISVINDNVIKPESLNVDVSPPVHRRCNIEKTKTLIHFPSAEQTL